MRNFPRPLTGLQSPFGAGESRPIWDYAAALGGAAPSGLTFSGANGTYFDSAGVLQDAVSNTARRDHNPSTLVPRGILIEPARTNSIRNNTAAGGSPGVLPTNWSLGGVNGLTITVVSVSVVNGFNVVRFTITGTPTVAGITTAINFDAGNAIAVVNGQTWTHSTYFAIVGGTTTNLSFLNMIARLRDVAQSNLSAGISAPLIAAGATPARYSATQTLANASVAYLQPGINLINTDNTTPINITFDVALPQLEQGAFASSVIKTTTVAVTRAADVPTAQPWSFSRASGKSWFNAAGVLTDYAADERVYDFDPATGKSRGLLVEPARTNFIRNNTMVGGSAGVLPTNWQLGNLTGSGMTRTLVGTGTENGFTYYEFRVFGTALATQFIDLVIFDSTTAIPAVINDQFAASAYWKLSAGTMTGLTSGGLRPSLYMWNSVPAYLGAVTGTYQTPTGSWSRVFNALTVSNASTACATFSLSFQVINGGSVDFTLRVAVPQAELGATATSPIKTSTVAVTRSADITPTNVPFYSVLEFELEGAAVGTLASIHGANASDAASAIKVAAGLAWQASTKYNDTEQGPLTPAGTPAAGNIYRLVHAVETNNLRACVNGGTIVQDISASVPVPANIRFGADGDGANASAFWLRRMSLSRGAPDNAKLIALTA